MVAPYMHQMQIQIENQKSSKVPNKEKKKEMERTVAQKRGYEVIRLSMTVEFT